MNLLDLNLDILVFKSTNLITLLKILKNYMFFKIPKYYVTGFINFSGKNF